MEKEKILVTGGAGFIGSNLCERLMMEGRYNVVSLDNYSTGSIQNHIEGVKYIKGHTKDISHIIDFKPTKIFHLGEYSRVEQSFDDVEKVLEYNKLGTIEVVEFWRKTNAKLIYAGSSTKFGDGGICSNTSPYAWSKASNTLMVANYGAWFNLPYAIVYFYNAYGPREISSGKYATLIALFMEKIRRKVPLTVVSPGNQKRNFTHVQDIVDGLIIVSDSGNGDGFGIGNPEEFSIIEIAEMFGGKIEMLPPRRGNRMTAEVITKKTEALGWRAKHSLRDYIDSFLKTL